MERESILDKNFSSEMSQVLLKTKDDEKNNTKRFSEEQLQNTCNIHPSVCLKTNNIIPYISPQDFSTVVKKLRSFFDSKGFLEVHVQNRLSILAACEDPRTIACLSYANDIWPLPQTGQMWLEYEQLKNPRVPGLYCVSTSYRNEPNPVVGRHNLIFPMFEFEMQGGLEELIQMEKELLEYLGYPKTDGSYPEGNYVDVAKNYNVKELEHKHETQLEEDYGSSFFLKNFPYYTSPFWNMKKNGETARKVDVILSGQETIGSAERSTNIEEMKNEFLTISDGEYSKLLFNKFGKERVMKELDEFLSHNFFKRAGGGIGISRLIRSMQKEGLMDDKDQ